MGAFCFVSVGFVILTNSFALASLLESLGLDHARPGLYINMPDIKFACPHCQQHIQAPEGYAGREIACPSCGGARPQGVILCSQYGCNCTAAA
jgi:Zn finger protein HypA/HybF involved in hydrogenase expression